MGFCLIIRRRGVWCISRADSARGVFSGSAVFFFFFMRSLFMTYDLFPFLGCAYIKFSVTNSLPLWIVRYDFQIQRMGTKLS